MSYVLELSRWGVSNIVSNTGDVALATNNSNGINNALTWASQQGYGEVILPSGTYLIHENIPIEPKSFLTFNLGGSTLRIRDNSQVRYGVISFQRNQIFSRVTNGKIQGDRYNHDYYSYNSDGSVFKTWTKWQPLKAYSVGDKVMPSNVNADNYSVYWQCTTAGTSGATEPTWKTGGTTKDGSVVWTAFPRHTHEWGHCILIPNTPPNGTGSNVRFISIDNLELFEGTGDGVALMSTFGWLPIVKNGGTSFSWEAGGINLNNGSLVVDSTRVRTSVAIDLTQSAIAQWGYFQICGGSYGGLGTDINKNNPFDVVFYNADGSFNSTVTNVEYFDEIYVPTGATKAKLVLHQSNVPNPTGDSTTLRVAELPKFVYIEKCHIHDDRRLGVSFQGAKNIFVRECDIHNIHGTGPEGCIDVEDATTLNQNLYFEKNYFHDTTELIILAPGVKNIEIVENKLERGIGLVIYNGVTQVKVRGNIIKDAGSNIIGEVNISDNYFRRSTVTITNGSTDNALIDNCVFHNSSLNVNRDKAFCVVVSNCKFYGDSDFFNSGIGGVSFSAGIYPQTMVNCSFEGYRGSSNTIFSGDPNATEGWTFTNVSFLNTKKATNQVGIKLARGTYVGCRFINPGPLDYMKKAELIGCTFSWDSYALFNLGGNTYDTLTFKDCNFQGGSSSALYLSAYSKGRIEITNSLFDYSNSNSTSSVMIEGYWLNCTGGSLILDGNRFRSNLAMKVFNIPGYVTPDFFPVIFRNNYLESPVNYILDTMQTKYNNYINGVLDPYHWYPSVPTTGYFKKGEIVKNSNMSTNGYYGWACTQEGFADNFPAWVASKTYFPGDRISVNGYVYGATIWGATSSGISPTFPSSPLYTTVNDTMGISIWTPKSYNVGDLVLPSKSNGYYYKCTTAGTSGATEPVWGNSGTVNDGTVVWTRMPYQVWKLLGSKATFKQFGALI